MGQVFVPGHYGVGSLAGRLGFMLVGLLGH